jgi:hypothetical protein
MYYDEDLLKCSPQYVPELLQGHYNFEKKENGGYENSYWNMLHYDNYRIRRVIMDNN